MKLKRIIALTLAGLMCVSAVGCGKKSKKKEEKVDVYDATMVADLGHSINECKIIGNELISSYADYNEEGSKIKVDNGFVKYNMDTKEVTNYKIDSTNYENDELYIQSYYIDADNNFVVKLMKTEETPSDTEADAAYAYSFIDQVYDKDFKLLSSKQGETVTGDAKGTDEEYDYATLYLKDGTKVVSRGNDTDKFSVIAYDKEGNELKKIDCGDEGIYSLYEVGDKVGGLLWTEDDYGMYEVDIENGKIGDAIIDFGEHYPDTLYNGKNDTLLFVENGALYRCSIESRKFEKVLKFVDSDMNPDNVASIFELEDGTIGVVSNNSDYTSAEVDYLTKRDPKASSNKTEITLGSFYTDSELLEKVIQFNKKSDKYRIVVKTYLDDNGEEDYDAALKKFNSDIVSGNCPDIIELSSVIDDMSKYSEKGVLEDLIPYFEKDSELDIDDFVPSIVDTYKSNGKLYALPQSFSINVMFGATSAVGSETSWNMKEFSDLAKSLPEGTQILQDLTSDGLLQTMLYYNMDKYVNWATAECTFNTDDFADLLELCSEYQSSEEFYKDYEFDENSDNEITLIRNKKLLMKQEYMDSIDTYMCDKAIFGETITAKGYPTEKGNGVVASNNGSLLAISSKSKAKDIAWEFIRQMYLPLGEDAFPYGFPIRQDDLDTVFENSKKVETYTDEDGNEQIAENAWSFDDIELKVGVPTDEDINVIKELIFKIDTKPSLDEDIYNIISEEATAYFEGQKSAKDVADVIQSRVSIYVKENK